jgi:AcrR family transcriptional regulator
VADQDQPISRAERRQRTEGRILTTARDLFSELGYERTTIRGIATQADVDPALVMQYFGSKERLFRLATSLTPDDAVAGDPERLTDHLLTTIGLKLDELPQASLAALRSALTHPDASVHVRDVLGRQIERIGAAIPAEDAQLRAGLIVTLMLGVSIQRHLIAVPPLDTAEAGKIIELLRPAVEALIGGPPPA